MPGSEQERVIARREYIVLGLLVIVFLGALLPSLLHSRRERRDGIRRSELVAFKQLMEQKNNELGYYPTEFDATPHQFIVTEQNEEQALEWYLRAQLENTPQPTAAFDLERNVYFRIVHEGGLVFYDICGGTSTCGAPPRQE